MAARLEAGDVLMHPHIIGEISLGSLRDRANLIPRLRLLPESAVANEEEVVTLIEDWKLFGTGIGYVDAHLLAATMLTPEAVFWTKDRRLRDQAERLGVAD